ncbi:MAG: hypothetical protein JW937_04430 [Candidatus Omnitrophica bacterium]|nr:hypothetical protein [Candidatus Omnitrophota bacterium]
MNQSDNESVCYSEIPKYAVLYAIPFELSQNGMRRHGREGAAHLRAYKEACAHSPRQVRKLVSVLLGDETHVAAIRDGKIVEMSEGYSKEGTLISATGCGNIDLSIIFRMLEDGSSIQEIKNTLAKESGFSALVGRPCSLRELLSGRGAVSAAARGVYAHQLLQHIGASVASLGGVDHIVFTGRNENSFMSFSRELLRKFEFAGCNINAEENNACGPVLTEKGSAIVALFILQSD